MAADNNRKLNLGVSRKKKDTFVNFIPALKEQASSTAAKVATRVLEPTAELDKLI